MSSIFVNELMKSYYQTLPYSRDGRGIIKRVYVSRSVFKHIMIAYRDNIHGFNETNETIREFIMYVDEHNSLNVVKDHSENMWYCWWPDMIIRYFRGC